MNCSCKIVYLTEILFLEHNIEHNRWSLRALQHSIMGKNKSIISWLLPSGLGLDSIILGACHQIPLVWAAFSSYRNLQFCSQKMPKAAHTILSCHFWICSYSLLTTAIFHTSTSIILTAAITYSSDYILTNHQCDNYVVNFLAMKSEYFDCS